MLEEKPKKAGDVKRRYDEFSKSYDQQDYFKTLGGKIDLHLEWKLLERYLPNDGNARVLDAGGGTGRLTLPLAKIGYQVILCDLSPGMLEVAKEKLRKEGILNRVEIKEADIECLPFPDETFDLVLCVGGALFMTESFKAASELARLMKKGAKIFITGATNRYQMAMQEIVQEPERALKLVKSELNYAYDIHGDWVRVFDPKELSELFERNGLKVIGVYGYLRSFLPESILKAKEWDDRFFSQIIEVMMYLAEEPSVLGLASNMVSVAEKM